MRNNTPMKILIGITVALLITVIILLIVLIIKPWDSNASQLPTETASSVQSTEDTLHSATEQGEEEATQFVPEETGIPLDMEHIQLICPTELRQQVQISYEALADGQQILFATDFTGEELELFRFSVSKEETQGYYLGSLSVDGVGEMRVCVEVKEYENGNWTPEEYNQLLSLQERVNDFIAQFYEDPRFVPAEGYHYMAKSTRVKRFYIVI